MGAGAQMQPRGGAEAGVLQPGRWGCTGREGERQACRQCANKHAEYEQARADRSWRGKEDEGSIGAVRLG